MSSSGEVYGMIMLPDRFNADVLLPNGLFMTVPCKREDTLATVKRQLWKSINLSSAKYFDIGDQTSFVFSAVTLDAKFEEFCDESRRLCDLRLFDLVLKLIEPEGNTEEKRLNSMIDIAIGKKINELFLDLPREIKDEVAQFRRNAALDEDELLQQIDHGQLYSSYTSYVDVPFKLRVISATYVNVKSIDSIFVRVAIYHGIECLDVRDTQHVEPSNPRWDQWLKFDVHCTELPRNAKICVSICGATHKSARKSKATPPETVREVCLGTGRLSLFDYRSYMRSGRVQINLWPAPKDSEDLVFPLNPLGNNPSSESPCLLFEIVSFDQHVVFAPVRDIYAYAAHAIKQEPSLMDGGGEHGILLPEYPATAHQNRASAGGVVSSSLSTSSTSIVNANYHTHYSSIRLDFRDRTLSNSCADTRAFIERRLSSSSNQTRRDSISTTYNENLTSTTLQQQQQHQQQQQLYQPQRSRRPTTNSDKFSAPSSRTSSTASMLIGRRDSGGGGGGRAHSNSIARGSHFAASDSVSSADNSNSSHSNNAAAAAAVAAAAAAAHTLTYNSRVNSSANSLAQTCSISPMSPMPEAGAAAAAAATSTVLSPLSTSSEPPLPLDDASSGSASAQSPMPPPPPAAVSSSSEHNIQTTNELIATPPFTPLSDAQKKLVWSMRFYCKRVPESLPKLLDATEWRSRNQLSQLYVLLDEWSTVSLETALRLFDAKYEDTYVRQHAVKWLDASLDDDTLSTYLLQFIQVLKTEPYLENELTKFLYKRSVANPIIGNTFFWYLKSECDEAEDYFNTIRFRYLLERYLRGIPEAQLSTLVRQVQGLDKLMNLAEALKDKTTKEERMKFMRDQLERVDFSEMLENIPDPTNHERFLGKLLIDDCRIMDSAKRPLWLVWSLPVMDDKQAEVFRLNPRTEDEIRDMIMRRQKRSHSYSGTKEHHALAQTRDSVVSSMQARCTPRCIKEEDSVSMQNVSPTFDPTSTPKTSASQQQQQHQCNGGTTDHLLSRFSSRTMTSSSDSAKTSSVISSVLGNIDNDATTTSSSNINTARNTSSRNSNNTNYTLDDDTASTSSLVTTCGHQLSSTGSPLATSAIIYKLGDDLRQDMLTLQIIRIVDNIWRKEGLDMCMLAYTCLATGKNVGIIEVVNRAKTITSIQKSGGRMATIQIDSTQLHRWIKEQNYDNYDEAIKRFTRSCAGYSVLTFVLGIADRNPDNIMVSEDGRIFHIDFGHFLGHFKKKFGINRERVPFVLTDDFLHVIAGGSDTGIANFEPFRQLCGEAYVTLRRHSNLLITLFTMMLRTGIPELRTLDDISYLKTSLQVGVSEEKAREFFQAQFFEAYCGAWATKVDWFFHNIKRL